MLTPNKQELARDIRDTFDRLTRLVKEGRDAGLFVRFEPKKDEYSPYYRYVTLDPNQTNLHISETIQY